MTCYFTLSILKSVAIFYLKRTSLVCYTEMTGMLERIKIQIGTNIFYDK